MSEFKIYTAEEYKSFLNTMPVVRKIKNIQLHHTYSPSYKQFTGNNHIAMQKSMRDYHVKECGYADIAQNLTIFPDGKIVTGRNLNTVPATCRGANTNGVGIECVGNFEASGDVMTQEQKNAILTVVKALCAKYALTPDTAVVYHSWYDTEGNYIGDYSAKKSVKTCPGTRFFGGNTRKAFESNLLPGLREEGQAVTPIESINDIIWELNYRKIITDTELWKKKCAEDINVYYLCKKMANYTRGTL